MYYEEKVINGILCWRGLPDGEFRPLSIEEITAKYSKLESEVAILRAKLDEAVISVDAIRAINRALETI